MARTVKDVALGSRAARQKLAPRAAPYFREIDRGLTLGYRRPGRTRAGKWLARFYRGDQNYTVEALAIADDLSDSNGVDVLNFAEAQAAARARRDQRSRAAAGLSEPLTVAAAMDKYFDYLEAEGKGAANARLAACEYRGRSGDACRAVYTDPISK